VDGANGAGISRDGVVVVPREKEDEVLAHAKAIDEAEGRIREAVAGGMRLDEARKKYKYFKLQSRDS
jgi:regulator of RNase E activity RraA